MKAPEIIDFRGFFVARNRPPRAVRPPRFPATPSAELLAPAESVRPAPGRFGGAWPNINSPQYLMLLSAIGLIFQEVVIGE